MCTYVHVLCEFNASLVLPEPSSPRGHRPHTHKAVHTQCTLRSADSPRWPHAQIRNARPSAHEHRPWTRRRHAHSYGHINYITPRAHPSHYTRLPPIRPPRIRVCKDGLSLFLHQEQHFGRLEEFDRLLLGWAVLELVLGGGRRERQRERRTGAACGRGELTRQQ